MHTEQITMARAEAAELYRKYRAHKAYSEPIDWEVQRTYQLLAQGKVIIRAIDSIKAAGLDDKGLPKLALAPATATACHIRRDSSGSLIMGPNDDFWHTRKNQLRFREETFAFPADSFLVKERWSNDRRRASHTDHKAVTPPVPVDVRPRRGLDNYHVLWEAEWEPIPPRDPYLLRRIGKADLWLVVAHWDLTEVERAALSTRI